MANSPFTYGMGDLAAYGSWNYFPGYGYGWQPMGMGNCWMPFMDGMWDFYPGLGWTWVSSEPWGWVPYHFGSWNYSPAYGWMWMPGDMNAWNPAPVQWYDMSNQVAWSPEMFSSGPSQMFLAGLGGWGGCGGSNFGQIAVSARQQPGAKNGSGGGKVLRGKLPVPPRFLLTAGKQLGGGGRVHVLAAGGATMNVEALPAPPLANGKMSRIGEGRSEASAGQTTRVVATTSASLNQLRGSMRAWANGSAVARMRLPSAPMPAAMPIASPIRNAGLSQTSMPHPPAPMRSMPGSSTFGARGGFSGGGSSGGGSFRGGSGPSFSAPHSAPAAPHASSGSSGKPH